MKQNNHSSLLSFFITSNLFSNDLNITFSRFLFERAMTDCRTLEICRERSVTCSTEECHNFSPLSVILGNIRFLRLGISNLFEILYLLKFDYESFEDFMKIFLVVFFCKKYVRRDQSRREHTSTTLNSH